MLNGSTFTRYHQVPQSPRGRPEDSNEFARTSAICKCTHNDVSLAMLRLGISSQADQFAQNPRATTSIVSLTLRARAGLAIGDCSCSLCAYVRMCLLYKDPGTPIACRAMYVCLRGEHPLRLGNVDHMALHNY